MAIGSPANPGGGVVAGQGPGPQRLGVPLNASDLAGKENELVVSCSQSRPQRSRTVQVGVPVNAAIAEELGGLEPRNHSEHPLLLWDTKAGLKSHQVPHLPSRI